MRANVDNPRAGFTLLEMLIVIAIIGVLMATGFVVIPREPFAVQQAAQGTARDVQWARFEAISRNAFVGLHPQQVRYSSGIYSGNGYLVFVDDNPRNYMYDNGETILKAIDFADSLAQLYQASTTSTTTFDVVFDPRGISRGNAKMQLTSRDRKYAQWVCVNLQGDARIKSAASEC